MARPPTPASRYFTLPEVALRLGLGRTRRRRRSTEAEPVTDEERAARAVRRLIRSGQLVAVNDGGRYLVREDWLLEYEVRREAAAISRRRQLAGAEWPASGSPIKGSPNTPRVDPGVTQHD